jgi:hypothetical protein
LGNDYSRIGAKLDLSLGTITLSFMHGSFRTHTTFFTKLVVLFLSYPLSGQTLGGNSAFNFTKLSTSAQLSALGSINISNISSDASLTFHNPSLLSKEMDQQLQLSFNSLYADIKNYSGAYVYHYEPWQTNFAAGVQFLNYGAITQTDASGNSFGSLRPTDYVIQLSASRKYLLKWQYGASVKFIHSNYGQYRSSAIAIDLAVLYYDTLKKIQASFVLKNMGTQIKKYAGSRADDLPFDVQIGITKRLANLPLQLSATAHHLHRFDILYNDTAFNNQNGWSSNNSKSFTIDKLFRHFVFSAQFFISDKLELSAGYHHLKRKELSITNSPNGLTGFSYGLGVLLKKIQIRYARNQYQNNTGYHQLGLNLPLDKW